jgi:hypothetical protein
MSSWRRELATAVRQRGSDQGCHSKRLSRHALSLSYVLLSSHSSFAFHDVSAGRHMLFFFVPSGAQVQRIGSRKLKRAPASALGGAGKLGSV